MGNRLIVLDTHALLWWTLEPKRLGKKSSSLVSANNNLLISSISIWEIGILQRNGKISLPFVLGEYVNRLEKVKELEILPVDTQIWLRNIDLPWNHRDPADRTIVATALLHHATLVTKDKNIKKFYDNTVW